MFDFGTIVVIIVVVVAIVIAWKTLTAPPTVSSEKRSPLTPVRKDNNKKEKKKEKKEKKSKDGKSPDKKKDKKEKKEEKKEEKHEEKDKKKDKKEKKKARDDDSDDDRQTHTINLTAAGSKNKVQPQTLSKADVHKSLSQGFTVVQKSKALSPEDRKKRVEEKEREAQVLKDQEAADRKRIEDRDRKRKEEQLKQTGLRTPQQIEELLKKENESANEKKNATKKGIIKQGTAAAANSKKWGAISPTYDDERQLDSTTHYDGQDFSNEE